VFKMDEGTVAPVRAVSRGTPTLRTVGSAAIAPDWNEF
jgi:hypothetical protein